MAITVQNRRKHPRIPTPKLKKIAQIISDDLGYKDADLSIVITDDATIQELNARWRGKDKATDVLSFSQLEGEELFPFEPRVLGDVVISAETAQRQASRGGWTLEFEYRRLLVHGVLHLLGHDHIHGGRQARKMRLEEERLTDVLTAALGCVDEPA